MIHSHNPLVAGSSPAAPTPPGPRSGSKDKQIAPYRERARVDILRSPSAYRVC